MRTAAALAEAALVEAQHALLAWYQAHRRDLPWRRHPTPYRVLVSELMLQQTQVDRVIPAFERFTRQFPGFTQLAAASRGQVIAAWAGLGYNRRAVYLHETARIVCERYGGELPPDRRVLLALPGIGPYTAGAVLSIAFGQDHPAVDTNAARVLGRFAFTQPPTPAQLAQAAAELAPAGRAADWNQALMDLGAAVCTARAPRCLICPLREVCASPGRQPPRARAQDRPFHQTGRYYRGRLLAALRDRGRPGPIALSEVRETLASTGVAEPPVGWETIGRSLVRDGLARVHETPTDLLLSLPD